MEELHKLENYDIDVLESIIKNEIEESINIEFKAAEALSKADSKKKEISKDVSAFANSDGGIIIYGISEKHHKAEDLSFINGNIFTKEWLEQIINTTIKRNISGLKIFPIRKDGDISKSIYVVQIPASFDAPHLSRDFRFYRRHNFESVPMAEYEIRQLYGRKVKSKLQLSGYSIDIQEINEDITIFRCETRVINTGERSEKDYKVNIYFDNFSRHININWDAQGIGRNYDYTFLKENNVVKLSNHSLPTIYPDETVNALRFRFEIKNSKILEVFKVLKIRFLLFYSNGEDQMEDNDLKKWSEKITKDIEEKNQRVYS